MTGAARLELRILGRSTVLRDGLEVPPSTFGGRKVRALVRVLATRQGEFVGYDSLGDMLWPDQQPANLAANLQVLVNRARRAVDGLPLVRTVPGGYALEDESHCTIDAFAFVSAVERAGALAGRAALQQFRVGLELWSGDPLPEDMFAPWAAEFRTGLVRVRQSALEDAARLAIEVNDAATAVEFGSAAVLAQPLREVAVLTLVRALRAAGDRAAALTRYDDYRRALAEELGVDPSPEAEHLFQELLAGPRTAHRGQLTRSASAVGELAFVGRERELDEIMGALDATGGCTVTVAGPSGAGKSRLLREVTDRNPAAFARAVIAERDDPWSLTREILREVLAQDVGFREALPPRLSAALSDLLPELDRVGSPEADAESRRALFQEATVRLLDAAGLLVVVDDLQWADPTSLELLEAARDRLPGLRMLLAFRTDETMTRPATRLLGQLRPVVRISLSPLPAAAITRLVTDQPLVDALVEDTDGTPMALVEVIRGLAAEGRIVSGADGRWRNVDAGAAHRAKTLGRQGQRDAISRRIAREPQERREVLELIGILGRDSPAALLSAALGASDGDVLDHLAALHRSGLARLGPHGWATAHDMIGDVVVAGLDPAAAARAHARVAGALEILGGDDTEMARHWRSAGDPRRAALAFAGGAQRALDGFADREAMALAGEGLALEPRPPIDARLREIRAQARSRSGDISGARADLRAALTGERSGGARSRIIGRLAVLSSGADDLLRAAELAELALVEAGEDSASLAQALEIAAVLDMNLDRPGRARERSDRALALYRALGNASGTARVLDAQAMATFLVGDVRTGGQDLRRVADLFEDSGDLVRVVTPRSTGGHAFVFAGRPAEGLQQTDSALDLARTLGHPEGQAYALWHRAEALAALGRADEALGDAREALSIATGIGHRGWTATAWRAIGIAAQALGDLGAALHGFHRSLDMSEHLDLFASWAASRAAMVHLALAQVDEARPCVELALRRGPGLGHYEARLAEVELAAATDDPQTRKLARAALHLATTGGVVQGTRRLVELAGSQS